MVMQIMFSLLSSAHRKEARTQSLSVSYLNEREHNLCVQHVSLCTSKMPPYWKIASPCCDLMAKHTFFNPENILSLQQTIFFFFKHDYMIEFLIYAQKTENQSIMFNATVIYLQKKQKTKKQEKKCVLGTIDEVLRSESHSCLASRSWLLLSFIFFYNVHRCYLIQLENVAMVLH